MGYEGKLREAEECVQALEIENSQYIQECEGLRSEKLKVERRLDLISEDLEVLSYQRD